MNETGLLYSQVGYDQGSPKKAVVRGPGGFISEKAKIEILDAEGAVAWSGPVKSWGDLWKTHWWTADFSELDAQGEYSIRLVDAGKTILEDQGLEIGPAILPRPAVH